ncbi:manganese/zinc/iron transport system permease protein [Brevibacterium sp. Mu109]|uniref:metal ABC transporter permease n=1 Tax=Brevibacterium sp. Mu109 TaxID=1255669 RepID=UPI000C5D74B2|nr:metal ABC transporter permease [Brevibacterium sp. Mu109]SMY00943.1 manganese/zinc/iron transport system permease protein [Brevibacterium sp. Mu109]
MSFLLGTTLVAVVMAVACALPGVFIVLRRHSMLVDGIAHAILPGIIVGYAVSQDLDSPWLILGAALAGLAVVLGNEYLTRTGLLAGDAPQGLVFPALFSIGVLMVTANFANIHLDTHAVLVGDLNLASFQQLNLQIPGRPDVVSLGPVYLYVMLAVLLVNVVFHTVFYRHLKLTTFDSQFARALGIPTGTLNTVFMFLVSVTVTAAFNGAGAILVIALVVVPPATAYLLTDRLPMMIGLTTAVAIVGAIGGFWTAYVVNAATSAGMSVFYGAIFLLVLVISRSARSRKRKASFNRLTGTMRVPSASAGAVPADGSAGHETVG